MLSEGTITTRVRSTVELDVAGQMLTQLRSGGLHGKAVIRLWTGARSRSATARLAVG